MRWALAILGVTAFALLWPQAAQAQVATPSVTVTPHAGLVDGQTVTLSEIGFVSINDPEAGKFVPDAFECVSGTFPVSAVLPVDQIQAVSQLLTEFCVRLGEFPVGVTTLDVGARERFTTSGGRSVQCGVAPDDCVFLAAGVAQDAFVGVGLASTPISFAPPITVKITPGSPMCAAKRTGVRVELVVRPKDSTSVGNVTDAVMSLTAIRPRTGAWTIHLKANSNAIPAHNATVVVHTAGGDQTFTLPISAFTCK